MLWIKKIVAVVLFVSLSACSTTGSLAPYSGGSASQPTKYSGTVKHHGEKSNSTFKELAALPFKAVGVVAVGLGGVLLHLGTTETSEYSDADPADDLGLVLSGVGLAAAGLVLTNIGDAIAE